MLKNYNATQQHPTQSVEYKLERKTYKAIIERRNLMRKVWAWLYTNRGKKSMARKNLKSQVTIGTAVRDRVLERDKTGEHSSPRVLDFSRTTKLCRQVLSRMRTDLTRQLRTRQMQCQSWHWQLAGKGEQVTSNRYGAEECQVKGTTQGMWEKSEWRNLIRTLVSRWA